MLVVVRSRLRDITMTVEQSHLPAHFSPLPLVGLHNLRGEYLLGHGVGPHLPAVLGVGCSLCWGEGVGLQGLRLYDDVGL
jgi:hypothetical protein